MEVQDLFDLMEGATQGVEDKQQICDALANTLRLTSNAKDVKSITYDAEKEIVIIDFSSGYHRLVNVAMDSGTAMIRDIMKHLGV